MKIPDLDDREFTEVLEHAKRQILVHSDEWTNHNASDTGIAILEVLSWLSETYGYQIDQITDDDWKKFLQLLGISQQPPQPAKTELLLTVPDAADGAVVPAGTKLFAANQSGETKVFETIMDETVVSESLEMVVTDADDDTVNNTTEVRTEGTQFYAFGDDPQPGDAMYLGFDDDPLAAGGDQNMLELTIDFYDVDLPEPSTRSDTPVQFDPSVELTWEYCTDYERWEDDESWEELAVVVDETDAFYEGGIIRLEKPHENVVTTEESESASVLGQQPGLVWLRCRVERAGYEIPPQLNTIRMNILDIEHRETVEDELLAHEDETLEATISAGQEFFFDQTPILEATIEINGQQWSEVRDFERSSPTDKHYVLHNERSSITFGDGINGAKPPVGETVHATRYVHGGGTDGNVVADTDWQFKHPEEKLTDDVSYDDIELQQLRPASGGKDMETIEAALDRFKRDLKESYRACTLEDYEYLATETPGLRFGRAYATTRTRETPDDGSVDQIHVIIVPYSTQQRPQPSEGFLDTVREHLNRNRLATDIVRVKEPNYVTVGGMIVVSSVPEYTDQEVLREIRTELGEYLHPVVGFDGNGWPFGQIIYRTELTDFIETLPGVRSVEEIVLTASGEKEIDENGNVLLPDDALPTLVKDDLGVTVTENDGGGSVR